MYKIQSPCLYSCIRAMIEDRRNQQTTLEKDKYLTITGFWMKRPITLILLSSMGYAGIVFNRVELNASHVDWRNHTQRCLESVKRIQDLSKHRFPNCSTLHYFHVAYNDHTHLIKTILCAMYESYMICVSPKQLLMNKLMTR